MEISKKQLAVTLLPLRRQDVYMKCNAGLHSFNLGILQSALGYRSI